MSKIIKAKTHDGKTIEFVDEIIGSGVMKDVYFSPDKSYVVALYRTKQDRTAEDRLKEITQVYHQRIFSGDAGNYWKNLFCWPQNIVTHDGRLGMVAPAYQKHFFFQHGSQNNDCLGIRGREKEGKWFAAANLRKRYVDQRELGDWLQHLRVCILIARAVKKLHAMGLAHSDLSYKNVLVDPCGGNACIIDIDGLVVPGKFPPDVIGTPDFIAPEVIMTSHLDIKDTHRKLPCIATDQHALAVLIYMYLLYRHPLRGGKVHDVNDDQRDEKLTMGEKALFVEHPTDHSNRIRLVNVKPTELPWADTSVLPYKLTGPFLSKLFERAFVLGLHNPEERPTADEWEVGLIKTVDLIQPCQNKNCEQKWYVFDNKKSPICPFCHTPYKGKLPVLNFYSERQKGRHTSDNHRLMVWTNQSLYQWHINRLISPNEKLTDEQKKRVGYFLFHNNDWWLINERLPDLKDVTNNLSVPIGKKVKIQDGQQIILSKAEGGRLAMVQMVEGK